MKKLIIVLLFIIFSCKSDKDVYQLNGYYYVTTSAEIYQFDKNKIFHYNFVDSTKNTYKLNLTHIQFGETEFEYQSNNDSIIIFDYFQEKNLVLKKIEFKDFNIVDLVGTEWKYPKNEIDSAKYFSRFYDSQTISNFTKHDGYIWAHKRGSDSYLGFFFNKFNIFRTTGGVPYLITDYNEEEMLFLSLDQKDRFFELKLKHVPYKNLDSNIVGNWIKTKDTLKRNLMTYISYINDKPEISLDSIRREYGYDSIEFTKNSFFINYVKAKNKVKKNRIRLDYDPQTNLIFLDSVKYENNYLQVEFLSRDTLRIRFPRPDLLFTYVRQVDKRMN